MQKAHALIFCVRVAGNSVFLAKTPVSLRCGLTEKQGWWGVVALAPWLYRGSVEAGIDGHRVGGELGTASAPCARPNREQACCSYPGKVRVLALPYLYWEADLGVIVIVVRLWMRPVVGSPVPVAIWRKEGWRYLRNTP